MADCVGVISVFICVHYRRQQTIDLAIQNNRWPKSASLPNGEHDWNTRKHRKRPHSKRPIRELAMIR